MEASAAVFGGVMTELPLEDAATSTVSVEFCWEGAGALSALPLANWLWFSWATMLGSVGVGLPVSCLGLSVSVWSPVCFPACSAGRALLSLALMVGVFESS